MSESQDEDREKLIRELQDRILAEVEKTYGPAVLDHWRNPRNYRTLEDPDAYARVQGLCGDIMEIFLRMRDDRIAECGFQTDGCGTTVVCGSAVTELAAGKPVLEALGRASTAGILRVLGGLPESDVHCAQLAAETLRRAVADYLQQKNSPWKKNYQKA